MNGVYVFSKNTAVRNAPWWDKLYSNSNPFYAVGARSGAREGVAPRGRRYDVFLECSLARFQRSAWRAICYARKVKSMGSVKSMGEE